MASCLKTPEGIQLSLEANEVDLIHFLGRELRRMLDQGDPTYPSLRPFHPSLQRAGDPESALTGLEEDMDKALMMIRLERIEGIQEELLHRDAGTDVLQVTMDEARTDLWLAYLADLRLLLSAVIGITPENPDPFMDQNEEDWTMEMKMYEFLSVLQEWLLGAVMGED
ncbi:DUF2017 family protein [Kiritimatiellota bacterium B12222]|nr:DUF2017 family protein [Kiritimatiellota bacterium B12222]